MKIPTKYLGIGIVIFHLIGIVGTLIPATRELTVSMTPFNLLLSTILIFLSQEEIATPWVVTVLMIAITGYAVEVLGVYTGQIFGAYAYGQVLGYSLLEVPLVIGLNWFMLVYLFGQIVAPWKAGILPKAGLAALGMTILDMLIEPVAIKLNYWTWSEVTVPVQNYLAWLGISFVMQVIFLKVNRAHRSEFVFYLLAAQVMYFTMILIFL